MTAVEWLIEQFNTFEFMYCDRSRIINIAKEMQKQQLEKTFKDAFVYGLDWKSEEISFNEYYNETFNK
jgi:hypothetical protein